MNIIKRIWNNLMILGNEDFNIIYDRKNNVVELTINKDLNLIVNGELNIITNNNLLCLDSVNSQLHFNGRAGKIFDDDSVARDYKQALKEDFQCEIEMKRIEQEKFKEEIVLEVLQKVKEKQICQE